MVAIAEVFDSLPERAPTPDGPPYEHRAELELLARSVLRLVMANPSPVLPLAFDPDACPNCGRACSAPRSPYCSNDCREESAFLRQFRASMGSGLILDPERQLSLGQKLWHLLGGDYPYRLSLLDAKAWQKVIGRGDGICPECGSPATHIDHIGTGCNRPINLRATCAAHRRTRDFWNSEFLATDAVRRKLGVWAARILSETALRVSDDPTEWDWRAYLEARQRKAS